jgi:hypothetical protein
MLDKVQQANATFPPQKIVAYGVPKIGKTTFASTFERPILIQIEDGASAIDMPTFPRVTSFDAPDHEDTVIGAIKALHGDHNYKTVVVDSLDWLEPLIWQSVCSHYEVNSIEEVMKGYGKGYVEAKKWWSRCMQGLDSLRLNKGMDVVLLAHSEIKRYDPPDGEAYDRYQMRLHKGALGMWTDWADLYLFLTYQMTLKKEDAGFNKERSRGIGTGNRIIHTVESPAFGAGNRWGLPDEILIQKGTKDDPYSPWNTFHEALTAATNGKYQHGGNNDDR